MAEAIFTYKEIKTTLKCNLNDKMKDIIDNFLSPIKEKGDNFLYLYNGKEINKDLSFNEQATGPDKDLKNNKYYSYQKRYWNNIKGYNLS